MPDSFFMSSVVDIKNFEEKDEDDKAFEKIDLKFSNNFNRGLFFLTIFHNLKYFFKY